MSRAVVAVVMLVGLGQGALAAAPTEGRRLLHTLHQLCLLPEVITKAAVPVR